MLEQTQPGERWSLNRGSSEFGCARETLRKALVQSQQNPGDDGCFSTAQICAALFGDLKAERTGLTRAQRESWELENKEKAGLLINVDMAISMVHHFTFAIRQKILLSSLSDQEKNNLLLELQRIGEMDFTKFDDENTEVAG